MISIEDVFREAGKLWPALAGITYKRIAKDRSPMAVSDPRPSGDSVSF